jgi:DNA-binding transcriptional MerR regulator
MRIGELARRAGTTTRTLRYYEARGLLPSARTANGYRSYDEEHLRLLQPIRLLQDFGFELEETRPFLECLQAGNASGDTCPASIEVSRRKLAELDACIARLNDVRDHIAGRLSLAETTPVQDTPAPRCARRHAPEEE